VVSNARKFGLSVGCVKSGDGLGLTLLAPDSVESILNGRQPGAITLAVPMRPFAVEGKRAAHPRCR